MKILSYIFFFLFCILFVDNFFFNPINEIFIIINCYNLYNDIYDGWKKNDSTQIRRSPDGGERVRVVCSFKNCSRRKWGLTLTLPEKIKGGIYFVKVHANNASTVKRRRSSGGREQTDVNLWTAKPWWEKKKKKKKERPTPATFTGNTE